VNANPIAVFDSGLGGLSVVRRLRELLPGESIVYFGDTARVPYGSKTRRTVANFSLELSRFLLQFNPKLIVAACNTSSALAMDVLKRELSVPVIGVVTPAAAAAVRAASEAAPGRIAILGTEATIASDAYPAAIHALAPQLEVVPVACPLLVPLVEEGRAADDLIVRLAVEDYLAPLRKRPASVAVLACTHYPLLRESFARFLGPDVDIVDSGRETSVEVARFLEAERILSPAAQAGSMRCFVSDNPARFRRVGSRFLCEEISDVALVSAEEYITGPLVERDAS
jgi:glutamate racemase